MQATQREETAIFEDPRLLSFSLTAVTENVYPYRKAVFGSPKGLPQSMVYGEKPLNNSLFPEIFYPLLALKCRKNQGMAIP